MGLRRWLFALVIGLGGFAMLVSLGIWQIQRLAWKEGVLARIEAQMASSAVALPDQPREELHEYLPVALSGELLGPELHVLTSGTAAGTGYRVVRGLKTARGRRVLLDLGLLPIYGPKSVADAGGRMEIEGNLLWPDDRAASTPPPDLSNNIWFARDVVAMAALLNTEEALVVVRSSEPADPRLVPLPLNSTGIANDHREYAITWFLLALVWASMTGYLLLREPKRNAERAGGRN